MHRTLTASVVFLSLLSLSGCLIPKQQVSVDPPASGTGEISRQVLVRAMPQKGNIKDEMHGKEMWFAYGAVSGTNDTPANGVTTAHFLEDGTYLVDVQMNIRAPEKGSFYEGWLTGGEPASWISLGRFTKGAHEIRQVLSFETSQDLRNRLSVAITLEKDGRNPLPSEVVAEGMLKVTKR